MKNKLTVQRQDDKATLARLMQAYVDDSIVLSDHEKKVFDILCDADELTKSYEYSSAEKRAKELAKRHSLSMSHARNMLKKAADLFNAVDCVDPATGARVLIHQLDEFISLCATVKDFKHLAAFMKLKVQVHTELVANKPIDPRLLQQNNYTFNIGGNLQGVGENVTRESLLDEMRHWKASRKEKSRIFKEVFPDEQPLP